MYLNVQVQKVLVQKIFHIDYDELMIYLQINLKYLFERNYLLIDLYYLLILKILVELLNDQQMIIFK